MENFLKTLLSLAFFVNCNVFADDPQSQINGPSGEENEKSSASEYQWIRLFTYTLLPKRVNLKDSNSHRISCIMYPGRQLKISFKTEDDFLVEVQDTISQNKDFCLKDDQIDFSIKELNEIIASQMFDANIDHVDEFYVHQYVYYNKTRRDIIKTFWGLEWSIYLTENVSSDCSSYYGDLLQVIAFSKNRHYVLLEGQRTDSLSFGCQRGESVFLPKEDLVPVPSLLTNQVERVDNFHKGQTVYHDIFSLLVYKVISGDKEDESSKPFCNIRYGEKLEILGFSDNKQLVLAKILPTGVLEDGRFYTNRMYQRSSPYDKKISFDNNYGSCQPTDVIFVLKDRLKTEVPLADIVFDTNINSSNIFDKGEEVYIFTPRYDFTEFYTIHDRVCRVHSGSKAIINLFNNDWPAYALIDLLKQKENNITSDWVAPPCLEGDQIISPLHNLSGSTMFFIFNGIKYIRNVF